MREKTIERMDDIFFDNEGKFVPINGVFGNTDGELSHMRNTFMESERDLFESLFKDPKFRAHFSILLELDSEVLLEQALTFQELIESGMLEGPNEQEKIKNMNPEYRDSYHMFRLEQLECYMCLLFAAVRDKSKKVHTLTPSDSSKHNLK